MQVNVLIFGPLKDITGTGKCVVNDVADTDQLIKKMKGMYPALADMQYLVAVEKDIVHGNTSLLDNYTVAMLPPYSGG